MLRRSGRRPASRSLGSAPPRAKEQRSTGGKGPGQWLRLSSYSLCPPPALPGLCAGIDATLIVEGATIVDLVSLYVVLRSLHVVLGSNGVGRAIGVEGNIPADPGDRRAAGAIGSLGNVAHIYPIF